MSRLSVRLRHRREQLRHLVERLSEVRRELRYLTPKDDNAAASASSRHIEAQLMKDYHRVEKALSFREPRREFGEAPRQRLFQDVTRGRDGAVDDRILDSAHRVIAAHSDWEQTAARPSVEEGGVVWRLSAEELKAGILDDPDAFFTSRHSVRDFDTDRPPDRAVLEHAVRLAQSAPSVCNRQAVSVNLYTRKDDVQRVLELHSGTRGFRELVPAVYVIHVDTRLFTVGTERNQKWIDGGLFAMTLNLAAHSLGLATCMLNWAVDNDLHDRMRGLLRLDAHQDIIVLMAVGYPPPTLHVARSQRRELEQVLSVDPDLNGAGT